MSSHCLAAILAGVAAAGRAEAGRFPAPIQEVDHEYCR